MKTETKSEKNTPAHAIAWLESEHPHGVDLAYVDYRDSLRENPNAIGDIMREGYSETIDEGYGDARSESESEIARAYADSIEMHVSELSDETTSAMQDWISEHDTSDVERALLRNTGSMLFFMETGMQYDKDDIIRGGFYEGSNTNEQALVKAYARTEEQTKEIETACRESFYSAPASFYFYADVEDVVKAVREAKKYVQIDGAYFATVDRVQGSNWLGDRACFTLAVPTEAFTGGLVRLDEEKGTGYGWGQIAGATGYDEAGVIACDEPKSDALHIVPEESEDARIERERAEHWEKTKTCTHGDMNMKRHAGTLDYKNDYPAGTTCSACRTFWID